jgi:hypothetical protein
MSNSLTVLINDVKKLLGLLNQVDTFAQSGGAGGRGGNLLGGSLGNVSTVATGASTILATTGSLIKTGLTTAVGVAAGASSMMPDAALTIGRQSAIYAGAVQSGSKFSTARLDQMMRNGLGNFQTSPGADARVLAMLTGRGMMPGTPLFTQTVASSRNAAAYLGMDNEVSASAFENLTSGTTSMMLMRNYGIFTSNPGTGETRSTNAIFGDFYDRFTAGRKKPTLQGTMDSLRDGSLYANIKYSGLDAAQQRLLSQYFIDRARGVNLDYSDTGAVEAQMKLDAAEGRIVNPMLKPYEQNSITSDLMSAATDEYLLGIEDSTEAMQFLSKHVKDELIPTFGRLKAFIDNFAGSNLGGGALGAGAALVGGAMSTVGTLAGVGLGSKLAGKTPAASGKGSFVGMGAKASPLMRGAGPAAAVLGAGAMATGNLELTPMSGATTGAMMGSFAGPKGAIIGGIIGLIAGTINQAVNGQKGNAAGGGGNIDPGPQGNNWTGAYGEPRPYGSGVHEGVDIPLAIGVEIKAVMDGVISFSGTGGGSLSRGLYITIDHGGGMTTLYSHLSKSFVTQGNTVMKGDVIGLSGNSGYSTGPHLHFGLYKNGNHQNPNSLVGLAYGGGGNKRQYSAASGVTESDLASGMTSGSNGASNSVVNNFAMGISGLSGPSAKQVLQSVLGSSSGSLGSSPTTSSSTALPEPIHSSSSSGMMGETNLGSSTSITGANSAVGGGYELGGTNGIDYGSNAINLSKKTARGNVGLSPNVTINLTIAQASESEARRFVKMVKEHLEEDNMLDRMGRR